MKPLKFDIKRLLFDVMIGTGGIGSGQFFSINGDHTLGREESRSGHFLDKKDYCKLHIISHYVKALLGEKFSVIPVGKIGNDDIGQKLLTEMTDACMNVKYVETDASKPTLFSFCFLYPDLSGGNLTTDDSACSSLNELDIDKVEREFIEYAGRGIALAVPEVPLQARIELLKLASKYKFFRVASFTSEEMKEVIDTDVLKQIDLLCINFEEASVILNSRESRNENVIKCAISKLTAINPGLKISITKGRDGSFLWDGSDINYLPSISVKAVSTAGAGDAFTAGLISGLALGLTLKESQMLATLVGAGSVLSPDTINKELNKNLISELIHISTQQITKNIYKLLED